MGIYPVGSFVRLNSGEYAVVVDLNVVDPLNPSIRVAYDKGMRQIPMRTVNLSTNDTDLNIAEVVNPDEYQVDIYKLIQ
jgi:hypothetical protein